ncbi:MAG: DUF1207 domain-containing protein [Bacteroidota bacterium]
MKRILVLLIVIAFSMCNALANVPTKVAPKLWEGRLNFQPLLANPFEGRVGAMYQFSDNKLRLDIGNSFDLIRIGNNQTIGADFFTFTRLRSEGNFKFPVETSDYFFGINVTKEYSILKQQPVDENSEYSDPLNRSEYYKAAYRLRLAHISSHLVDGLVDTSGLLKQHPFVYSREFADLIGTLEWKNLRTYAGLTFVWATQPRDAERLIPQLGIEYKHKLSRRFYASLAYDFKLIGISDKYIGTHAAQGGISYLSEFEMPALSLNIYGYHGRSMHGMFYKEKDSYIGTGFQFLF